MPPSDQIPAATYNPGMSAAPPGVSGAGRVPGQAGRPRRRWPRLSRSPHDAEILRLAVPAFGALVAEPLFLLADSAIVGRIGTTALGGLGVASQALTTLVSISIFLAYGTTAAVARQLGAGNRPAAIRQGIDGLWLAGAIGAVVLAAGWPLAPAIIHAFGASPGVTGGAVTYLRISLLVRPPCWRCWPARACCAGSRTPARRSRWPSAPAS